MQPLPRNSGDQTRQRSSAPRNIGPLEARRLTWEGATLAMDQGRSDEVPDLNCNKVIINESITNKQLKRILVDHRQPILCLASSRSRADYIADRLCELGFSYVYLVKSYGN